MTPTAKRPKGSEIIACDKDQGSETTFSERVAILSESR